MVSEMRVPAATAMAATAAVLVALDSILVRHLTETLHPFVIVFFRSLFGLLFIAPWILRDRSILASHFSILHIVRATLKMLSLVAFFMALASAALADVTAIMFTTPLFVTLGAWQVLGERLSTARLMAIAAGFAGVLIILQPGLHPGVSAIPTALLYALIGALLAAVIQIMLKHMSERDSTQTLVAWNLILIVPVAAIPLYWFWAYPSPWQMALLALQGAMGILNMSLVTKAMSLAPASVVSPVEFLRLPAVALLAYLLFAELPTTATFAGATIIFIATLAVAKSQNSKPQTQQ